MFETYNEKARRAMFFARYEASKLDSRAIESEHLLLGILREGEGTVREILRHFQVRPDEIRREIEGDRVFIERISSTAELPLSEESKKILAYASDEVEGLPHAHVGCAHLLIGILRVEGSMAMRVLAQHGFDVDTVREVLARPRKVFISNAWSEDDTLEGKTRTGVVDALQAALEENGFETIRGSDRIRDRESISAFLDQLTPTDLLVTVISDKHLRSPYGMYEIYRLWERYQDDAAELAQQIVPIVLPDVKVGTFRERTTYLKHWAEVAESLEGFRLTREFSDHIDYTLLFLNDVLLPCQLEAHLDEGFPAVWKALRRRLEPSFQGSTSS
jgi:Clp amino terminal domain, pathogenicity island component